MGKFAILSSAAVMCGVIAALFADIAGANPVRVAALPVAAALTILLLTDKRSLVYLIILLRSAGDPIFSFGKFELGTASIGLGGALNGLMILIAALFFGQQPETVPRRALWMWAGFLVVVFAAAIRSPIPGESMRLFLVQLSYCAVFVIAFYMVQSRADLEKCIRIMLLSSLVPILYASMQVAPELLTGSVAGMRIKSSFSHANVFAFYLVLIVAIAMYALKGSAMNLSTATRCALWAYVPVLLAFLMLTGTRSAWIACLLLFLMYGLFIQLRYVIYVAGALLVALFIPGVMERLVDLARGNEFVQGGSLNSFAWRLSLWESALPWIKTKWLLGHGLDSFLVYSPEFFRLDFFKRASFGVGAHNTYLRLLFETGLVGLLAYLILFGALLSMLRGVVRSDRVGSTIAMVVVAAYLVISASDNMEYYLAFNWYFWFFLGVVCASPSVMPVPKGQIEMGETDAGRKPQLGPVRLSGRLAHGIPRRSATPTLRGQGS
jgi:O-antigen ligase